MINSFRIYCITIRWTLPMNFVFLKIFLTNYFLLENPNGTQEKHKQTYHVIYMSKNYHLKFIYIGLSLS